MFIRRPSDLGALVRATRLSRGLNQQGLADRLGVSRWWVNEFEGGKPTARLDIVLRALAELEITLSASTNAHPAEPVEHPSLPASPIDIDDIADTGLTPRNSKKADTAGRRRR